MIGSALCQPSLLEFGVAVSNAVVLGSAPRAINSSSDCARAAEADGWDDVTTRRLAEYVDFEARMAELGNRAVTLCS